MDISVKREPQMVPIRLRGGMESVIQLRLKGSSVGMKLSGISCEGGRLDMIRPSLL